MTPAAITPWFVRARLERLTDALAVVVAVSLPWSTSATGALIVLWCIALLPTLDLASLRRALAHPAGACRWRSGCWGYRDAVGRRDLVRAYCRAARDAQALGDPLLFVQFQRSDKLRGFSAAFLLRASCCWSSRSRPILSQR